MQFNKLYNLILLSIILEDINSKIKKAIDTLIKSGLLKDLNDPRAEQVKTIIKRNANIDINGKTKLALLLKTNLKYINRAETIDLDSIPQFSLKKLYSNGVVIYKVEDSKKAMKAVRKIVDNQWGEDANPWCLITPPLFRAWDYWKEHSAYPKHIAFQNGKLLAFCASSGHLNLWWDRQDKSSPYLKVGEKIIKIELYKWSLEEYKKVLILREKLELNLLTGLYDSYGDVLIKDCDLIDGHFPIPFGHIRGDFSASINCYDLTSLLNVPKEVDGRIVLAYKHLPSRKELKRYEQLLGNKKLSIRKGCVHDWIVIYE